MLDLFARNRVATLVAVLVVAYAAIGAVAPGYLSGATASVILSNSLVLMLISLGTMIVILTRNIDVSSGSVLGLSAVRAGLRVNAPRAGGMIRLDIGYGLRDGQVQLSAGWIGAWPRR